MSITAWWADVRSAVRTWSQASEDAYYRRETAAGADAEGRLRFARHSVWDALKGDGWRQREERGEATPEDYWAPWSAEEGERMAAEAVIAQQQGRRDTAEEAAFKGESAAWHLEEEERARRVRNVAAHMSADEAHELIDEADELHRHTRGCNQDVSRCSTCSAQERETNAEWQYRSERLDAADIAARRGGDGVDDETGTEHEVPTVREQALALIERGYHAQMIENTPAETTAGNGEVPDGYTSIGGQLYQKDAGSEAAWSELDKLVDENPGLRTEPEIAGDPELKARFDERYARYPEDEDNRSDGSADDDADDRSGGRPDPSDDHAAEGSDARAPEGSDRAADTSDGHPGPGSDDRHEPQADGSDVASSDHSDGPDDKPTDNRSDGPSAENYRGPRDDEFPTRAQEDAYAQGLVLSPEAAEAWARGEGPDPAEGPITRADLDEFEQQVREQQRADAAAADGGAAAEQAQAAGDAAAAEAQARGDAAAAEAQARSDAAAERAQARDAEHARSREEDTAQDADDPLDGMPAPGTPEYDALVLGVLAGNVADLKGWAARLADDPAAREVVIREIAANARKASAAEGRDSEADDEQPWGSGRDYHDDRGDARDDDGR